MSHWTDKKSNNGYGYGQYTALDVLQITPGQKELWKYPCKIDLDELDMGDFFEVIL